MNALREIASATNEERVAKRNLDFFRILRNYRRLLYCKLYERSLQIFDATRTRFVYGIATPEIYRFFTRSSKIMRPLAGMRLAKNIVQHPFAGTT